MCSYVFTIELKDDPDVVESYKKYHRQIWPEVKRDLKNVGIQNMRTYLLGRRMVTFIQANDGFDPAKDLANYATCDRTREWDRIMGTYLKPVKEAKPDEWWAPMEQVYDSEW
jgi:L-rhamnose mutarotase